jgi:superfamily II helicase
VRLGSRRAKPFKRQEHVSTKPTVASPQAFSELGLSDLLAGAVRDAGYSRPTPVQSQAIPAVLTGADAMVRSRIPGSPQDGSLSAAGHRAHDARAAGGHIARPCAC